MRAQFDEISYQTGIDVFWPLPASIYISPPDEVPHLIDLSLFVFLPHSHPSYLLGYQIISSYRYFCIENPPLSPLPGETIAAHCRTTPRWSSVIGFHFHLQSVACTTWRRYLILTPSYL